MDAPVKPAAGEIKLVSFANGKNRLFPQHIIIIASSLHSQIARLSRNIKIVPKESE